MWSFLTLIIALWRMKVRKITFSDLGLRKPDNLLKTVLVTFGILLAIPLLIIAFQQIQN